MHHFWSVLSCFALLAGSPPAASTAAPMAHAEPKMHPGAASPSFRVTPLHFKVRVGPEGAQTCDIVGDLYRPRSATRRHRAPAVLTTNGFGGSKADQAPMAKLLAGRGYVVLSYSGLGFGGSGCKISLDDPDVDGQAARQLVSYLGGKRGIAFRDAKHTQPAAALRVVRRDSRNHRGRASRHDPRVGMIGASYGGQVQFAAASVDPRIDTIIPSNTWNDLSYSLAPNNLGTDSRMVGGPGAGTVKLMWGLGFSAMGLVSGLTNAGADPARLLPCPNFATFVCPALVVGALTGGFDDASIRHLRHASVASYVDRVRIPTLLLQGQNDTLFNLNEATATFRALRAQGTPVKMVWQWFGHSMGVPAPGEQDLARPDPRRDYLTGRIVRWLDHHLKDRRVGTGPRFAWFRDWVEYSGNAGPAYGTAARADVGTRRGWHLSGTSLVRSRTSVQKGRQSFLTPVAGLPTSTDELDAIGELGVAPPLPEADLPGTFAAWTGPELSAPVDVVGAPKLRIKVSAPASATTQALGPTGQLVLFAKLVDVAPDGKGTVVRNLVAPVRVKDVTKPFRVTMPAIVHRFEAGHRLRLVLAGGSTNYRGNLVPNAVTVSTGGPGQVLTLPVLR